MGAEGMLVTGIMSGAQNIVVNVGLLVTLLLLAWNQWTLNTLRRWHAPVVTELGEEFAWKMKKTTGQQIVELLEVVKKQGREMQELIDRMDRLIRIMEHREASTLSGEDK